MNFIVYYTLGAIITYFLAANILDRIEVNRGARFEHRNLIFFALIFGMAMLYMFLVNPEPPMPPSGMEPTAPAPVVVTHYFCLWGVFLSPSVNGISSLSYTSTKPKTGLS